MYYIQSLCLVFMFYCVYTYAVNRKGTYTVQSTSEVQVLTVTSGVINTPHVTVILTTYVLLYVLDFNLFIFFCDYVCTWYTHTYIGKVYVPWC